MKKLLYVVLFLLSAEWSFAQTSVPCNNWRISGSNQLFMPLSADKPSVDGKKFDKAALLENVKVDASEVNNWQELSLGADSLITSVTGKDKLFQLAGFVQSDRWTKATMSLSTPALFELYLDGKKVKTQSKSNDKPVKVDLTLTTGVHQILLKLITATDSSTFSASISPAVEAAKLLWSTNPKRMLTITDVLDGESVSNASVSPSGKYLLIHTSETITGSGKRQSSFRVYDLELKRNLFALRNESVSADWMPKTDRISYRVSKDENTEVYIYDIKTGEETKVASGLDAPGRIQWSPNEDYFLYSKSEEGEKTGDLKRVFGNNDRIPGFRQCSFLYYFDLKTQISRPLTAGAQSTYLQDIKPDGLRVLISSSKMDYTEVPFSKQTLLELELSSMKVDTIWSDKLYSGNCQYSPDGTQLLVSGAPETFGDLGVKVSQGRIPNSYDTQLYLFDLKSKKAEPLTRDFDPAIGQSYWAPDGSVYLTVDERDCVHLYRLDMKKRKFSKIDVPVEVINSMDYAQAKPLAVFTGTGLSTPEKLYSIDLNTGKSTLLLDPKAKQLADVEYGKSEEWNFVNASGTTISGYVYYPVGYDPARKYPVIVNYYGGTTTVNRSFGGRYPQDIWAAEGYLVYVLQPSGAIGFGQDFSALHVNGWGRDAIEDIIDGTKKFLAAHPAADAENVGCIGASYGGFTTMMLQTRTDIFKTAISHAGISDISSYWGEGYWGYSYSSGATKFSYPWNRKDIYVDNSPLFRADQFQNSILLLHGTADTNVPVGESLQFYAALKILGKDVEMVLVSGENHHIVDYDKRLKWHNTIMAWFDKKLKNQPEHWTEIYPDKNL